MFLSLCFSFTVLLPSTTTADIVALSIRQDSKNDGPGKMFTQNYILNTSINSGHFRENMDKSLGNKYQNFERIFGYYDRI